MVAIFLKFLKRKSPSDKDFKNKILIFYHLTFHNDLSNTWFLKWFSINAGFQKYHRVRLIMIKNIFVFLNYHVRNNILHSPICICIYVNKACRVCTWIVEWCNRSAFTMSGGFPHTCFLLSCIKIKWRYTRHNNNNNLYLSWGIYYTD
jgi:hypothetical protein